MKGCVEWQSLCLCGGAAQPRQPVHSFIVWGGAPAVGCRGGVGDGTLLLSRGPAHNVADFVLRADAFSEGQLPFYNALAATISRFVLYFALERQIKNQRTSRSSSLAGETAQ